MVVRMPCSPAVLLMTKVGNDYVFSCIMQMTYKGFAADASSSM